jgi:hypothetical protein
MPCPRHYGSGRALPDGCINRRQVAQYVGMGVHRSIRRCAARGGLSDDWGVSCGPQTRQLRARVRRLSAMGASLVATQFNVTMSVSGCPDSH